MHRKPLLARLPLVLGLLALVSAGCHHHHAAKPPAAAGPAIRAKITLPCTVCDSRDFSVRVVFTNVSETKVKLNHFVVQFPQLVLDVFNARGKRVPQLPPPVPIADTDTARFEVFLYPDESYEVSYPLAIPTAQLPDGGYFLRARAFPSNTVTFKLKARPE